MKERDARPGTGDRWRGLTRLPPARVIAACY
jgi:hypothetical protein